MKSEPDKTLNKTRAVKLISIEEIEQLLEQSRRELRNCAEHISDQTGIVSEKITLLEQRMLKLVGHVNDLNRSMDATLENYMRCCALVQFFPGKKKGGEQAIDMITNLLNAKRAHKPPL